MRKFTLFLASLLVAIGAMAQTTTIDVAKTYTLECNSSAAHSTARFIGVTDGVINGQSATGAEITFEAVEEGSYYIKVGDKYINHNGTAISASAEASTAWVLGTVNNLVTFKVPETTLYLNNVGSDCTDGTVTNLKGNNHASGPNANNACSTWAMVEYVAPEEGGDEETTDLTGKKIASIGEAATSVTEGGWYLLNNVGRSNIVCEETTAMKMRATNSVAAGNSAEDVAGYLFKITKASDGSHYNIMSGNGKYFALGWNSSSISETPVNFLIDHINANNANVFYIYDDENKYCADGQETGNSFVGWNSTIPTSAGGNDSYRLLPVTLADALSKPVVTYNFIYDGKTKFTQTAEAAIGAEFPAINIALPFGVTATKPAGTVSAENTTQEIELSINLPFIPAESYETIEHWYYLNITASAKYLYHTAGAEYIELSQTAVDANNKDAYTWGFIGNPFDGYKIVNYAAGDRMILSSVTNVAGSDTGASVYPILMNEAELTESNNTLWIATTSSNRAGVTGFYLAQKDFASNRMNNRGDKLAYWTGGADAGSTFAVVERPMGPVAELGALVAEIEAANIVAGENIGDYTSQYAAAVTEALATANEKIVAGNVENSDIEALQAVYDNVSVVLPDPDKFYTFNCIYEGRVLRINENNQMKWEASGYNTSKAVFQFEAGSKGNTVKIKSVHTQSYMGEISGNITFGETGAEITLARSNSNEITDETQKATAVMFTTDGSNGIHANTAPVMAFTNGAISNHYVLTEVESFSHTLAVGEVGYSTLMLGFNATIPAGVECYYAAEAIDENGVLNLTKVEGTLPANTAVIVKAEANNYDFAYTDATATVSGNLLSGTLYTKSVPATAAYVLSAPDNKVGLYKATLTDGAFQNNANKAFFKVETANGIASYSFNFDWAGTTGIDGVVAEGAENGAIYDITGRRVKAITAPGIYIVNGKKVVK